MTSFYRIYFYVDLGVSLILFAYICYRWRYSIVSNFLAAPPLAELQDILREYFTSSRFESARSHVESERDIVEQVSEQPTPLDGDGELFEEPPELPDTSVPSLVKELAARQHAIDDGYDFLSYDRGTIVSFLPLTPEARQFAQDELGLESWQWLGGSFNVDHRPAAALIAQLEDEGWRIERH